MRVEFFILTSSIAVVSTRASARTEFWANPRSTDRLVLTAGRFSIVDIYDTNKYANELEERHELRGQPGKIKITGYLERGSMDEYPAAVALAQASATPADINAVRSYASRPGVSLNVEQQVNDNLGLFFLGISAEHVAFLNAGGLGIYSREKISEAYYSCAVTASTRFTFDYQFLKNRGDNADRGPANIFAGRAHWQF